MNNVVDVLQEARDTMHYVFVMGNGGSAAIADHFACDLMKVAGIMAISLNGNMAVFSAYANDCGYKNVFVEQLKVLSKPGDVIVGISGSGNSPNIIKAIKWANENYMTTIGITGGGKLETIANYPVVVFGLTLQEVEDSFSEICHTLSDRIR